MKCKHCGGEVVLVPSAAERAAKYGGQPSDYTKLFEYHAECELAKREEGTRELMRRTAPPPSVALRVQPIDLWSRSRRR